HDYVQTYSTKLSDFHFDEANRIIDGLKEVAVRDLGKEGFSGEDIQLEASLDLRYVHQAYEITVPLNVTELTKRSLAEATTLFHEMHEKIYGFKRESEELELINIRLVGTGVIKELKTESAEEAGQDQVEKIGERQIYFGDAYQNTPIYDRNSLKAETTIAGPAVIEQLDSTIIVHPNQ